MMNRSNATQVSTVVSQSSKQDYDECADETNPWAGDFDSDDEQEDYVNHDDLPGVSDSNGDQREYVNQDDLPDNFDLNEEQRDYVNQDDLPGDGETDDEDYIVPGDQEPKYETVDDVRKRSIRSNPMRHPPAMPPVPVAQVFAVSDQPPPKPRQLSSYEIVQKDVPLPPIPPPPVPRSHSLKKVPPVPTDPRPSLFPSRSEVPSVQDILSNSPVPAPPEVPSASKNQASPVTPSHDVPVLSSGVPSSSLTSFIPTSQPEQNSLHSGSASKQTPPTVLSKRRPKKLSLESHVWYVGDCAPEEADELLRKSTEDGTFIVRNSQRSGQPYTLCVLHEEIRRFPIRKRKEDGYFALGTPKPDEAVFSSVAEMINFYRSNPIEYGKEWSKVTLRKAATE